MNVAVSRREFLLSMFSRAPAPTDVSSDAPIVAPGSCEARFGCRKCVEVCPAPGALRVEGNSLNLSKEYCVRCALCATVCPVGAIQVPDLPDDAYRALLETIQESPDEKKTLVITCDENSVPNNPRIVVKQVSEIGVMGVRQLAMAANTAINATIVYCPDGLCVSKEHVKRAANLIAGITKVTPPLVYYLEGRERAGEIERIHNSSPPREGSFELSTSPWRSYVDAVEHISAGGAPAAGLGVTDVQIAESCTLCNACVDRCPHKALAIQTGELIFNPRECTGCGYCEQICPEHSITLLTRDGAISFAERSVYRDEMVRCSKCNAPYASAKLLQKVTAAIEADKMIPLCSACKEQAIYEKLFGKTSHIVVN